MMRGVFAGGKLQFQNRNREASKLNFGRTPTGKESSPIHSYFPHSFSVSEWKSSIKKMAINKNYHINQAIHKMVFGF